MPQLPLIDRLRSARVVPVIRTSTAAHAATAVEWLRAAGIRIFEITMTIPGAVPLIRQLATDQDLLIGAGTVPDAGTAQPVWTLEPASSSPPGSILRCVHPAAKPTPH
jgi:2-dehydro-3-deoxyphosphogluconate aldolase/(4S)-4-hydroxy-2-oxoglutarate aldolase